MWCHHLCPEKKGSQGWAISLPCVHSNETWRRLHEIYTYLTVTVYWASCFVQHCQFANRLRDSELKISFEDSHHPDRPLSAWTSKVSFLRGTISKEDTHITIGEAWERCDVSVSEVERTVSDDLNLKKTIAANRPTNEQWNVWTRWTPLRRRHRWRNLAALLRHH